MDERLEFEDNFNNKLNCQCFTTIRIHQPVRNAIGAVKQVYLKGVWKGNARIIHATTITMDRINLPMAKLDTGLSLEECQRADQVALQEPTWHQLENATTGLYGTGVCKGIERTEFILKEKGE